MRHLVRKSKLNRPKKSRESMIISLTLTLLDTGKVRTTVARTKVVKAYAQRVIHRIKSMEGVELKRYLQEAFKSAKTADKVIAQVKPKLVGQESGKLSFYRIENRVGDNSSMAMLVINFDTKKNKSKKENKK